MRELKIARKTNIGTIVVCLNGEPVEEGKLTELARSVLYPSDTANERLIQSILFELQRDNPQLIINVDDSPPFDYVSGMDAIEQVAVEQEKAIETLRESNEVLTTEIARLEGKLQEAQESNEDWARRFKELQGGKIVSVEEEQKPS